MAPANKPADKPTSKPEKSFLMRYLEIVALILGALCVASVIAGIFFFINKRKIRNQIMQNRMRFGKA